MTPRFPSIVVITAGLAACVSYDPAGPPVPRIDGTYAAMIVLKLENTMEIRTDTFTAAITIRGTGYRGHFGGEGYERMKTAVLEEMRHHFRPEFLNRVDEIIVFHSSRPIAA